ncbi:oligosaccharyl transferase subunit OST3/OST6 family [Calocera viscosa TUFC12733]|uniref:Oligosaccharyl transferase subunit OST3/OST6 family n=1 Tax=Calocera viscosa (strain TUFC12733) TaxID=1330018 RepID=A0A167KZG8_CALVF|nr:oligosaccharyl transferase subunit OST3/OST6 family [Calocera viscosa TUFC12733]
MQLLPGLLLTLLACLGSVVAQASHAELVRLAASNGGVIKLTPTLFNALTAPNREWSAAIQLTALSPQFRCSPCTEFNPSFKAVAKAWSKVPAEQRDQHFFATLDFLEGQDIFKRLGLSSAPVLQFYPALEGPHVKPKSQRLEFSYDFNRHGFAADGLAHDLSSHTPVPIPFTPPFNWQPWFFGATFLLLSAIAGRFAWMYLGEIIMNRWLWAVLTVVLSLVMTSGYMFVQIRGMPYSQRGSMIAGGFQNQYGIETNLVAALYGLLGSAYLALILLVPRIPSPTRQRASIYLWTGIVFVLFSILLSFFRIKNGGYPFKLLL